MTNPGAFFGRERELAWLLSQFNQVALKGENGKHSGPRMAVVLAETGYGKSRLVQELYLQLSKDPKWDSAKYNYWPDAFRNVGAQLRVTPDMTGTIPKGPPQFMWLGVRWQPTDQRNVDLRPSLPDLDNEIRVHLRLVEQHGDLFKEVMAKTRRSFSDEWKNEAAGQIFDNLIPFGGLAAKLLKGAAKMGKERLRGPRSHEEVKMSQEETLANELLKSFEALLEGPQALPTVLWLDDAQWIDAQMLRFLHRLWQEADKRCWPLLTVVTHWEREWLELEKLEEKKRNEALISWEGRPGFEIVELQRAPDEELCAYMMSRLPGLTKAQQEKLLEKASGNFLTMVENIGDLTNEPELFEGLEITGALTASGEHRIQTWESDREYRVKQRFSNLEPNVRKILGWSSRLGVRFLHGVVVEFAERHSSLPDAKQQIQRCVDPLAILGATSRFTREFRDKAFHIVAQKYYKEFGSVQDEALSAILREHTCRYINASFGPDGHYLNNLDDGTSEGPPEDSAVALMADGQSAELRDLLSMALRELPRPQHPDWTSPQSSAWLRAIRMAIQIDEEDGLWDRIRSHGQLLLNVLWKDVPESVIGLEGREATADRLRIAGSHRAALALRQDLVRRLRKELADTADHEAQSRFIFRLLELGNSYESFGKLDKAQSTYQEALETSRKLVSLIGAQADSRRCLSSALGNVGDIAKEMGDMTRALSHFKEALSIDQALVDELGTQESRRDVACSLEKVGGIYASDGEMKQALTRYEEALVICRDLAQDPSTVTDHRRLVTAIWSVGNVAEDTGDLKKALKMYEEALSVARDLAEEFDTPEDHKLLWSCLGQAGGVAERNNDLQKARTLYEEALSIARAIADEDDTQVGRRCMSGSHVNIGNIAKAINDHRAARLHYGEALSIARALKKERDTQENNMILVVCLFKLGDNESASGDIKLAQTHYDESLALTADRSKKSQDLFDHNEYVWSSVKCAGAFLKLNHPAQAEQTLAACRNLLEKLELSGDRGNIDTAAAFWEHMTSAAEALGNESDAAHSRERSRILRARLAVDYE